MLHYLKGEPKKKKTKKKPLRITSDFYQIRNYETQQK